MLMEAKRQAAISDQIIRARGADLDVSVPESWKEERKKRSQKRRPARYYSGRGAKEVRIFPGASEEGQNWKESLGREQKRRFFVLL